MFAAIETEDCKAIQRIAHTYKGSASIFHLGLIVETAQRVEQLASEGDISKVKTLAAQLKEDTKQACALLEALSGEVSCAS